MSVEEISYDKEFSEEELEKVLPPMEDILKTLLYSYMRGIVSLDYLKDDCENMKNVVGTLAKELEKKEKIKQN